MIGSAGIDRETRKRVYKRDGYRCALCDDTRTIQIHHVVPRGKGGPMENEMNLITLCPKCHCLVHGTDIDNVGISKKQVQQAIVEYLSELYACEGIIWNPWSPEKHEWKF